MILLTFLPLYLLTLAANLAMTGRFWYWLVRASLAFFSFLILLTGLGLLVGGSGILALPDGTVPDTLLPGLLTGLSGLAGLLVLLPALRAALVRGLRLQLEVDNSVHLLALVLAIWFAGLTLAQLLLLRLLPVETLTDEMALTLGDVWEQGIAFVLFALLGVGLGLRRSVGETLERLGLVRPTARHIGLALAVTLLLTLWDGGLSWSWQALEPDSYERIRGISELLFAGVQSPIGALSIGLSAGIGEELLFRGAIQPRFGLLAATLLFTVGHSQYELSPALLSVFVSGLVLGIVRARTNTTTAVLVHAAYNIVNVLLPLM